jgi:hypothetical protein
MEFRYVKYIRDCKSSRKGDRVWQNVPVPNGKPGEGFCYKFTTDWLLGLLEQGLRGQHANGGLVSLDGFCEIQL